MVRETRTEPENGMRQGSYSKSSTIIVTLRMLTYIVLALEELKIKSSVSEDLGCHGGRRRLVPEEQRKLKES